MRLRIDNMGPLELAILDRPDDGAQIVRGPSASGKTTRMLALFFALYGTDQNGSNLRENLIPMIRDGADWMSAAVTLPGGFAIKRAMHRDGSVERWVSTPDGIVKLSKSLAEREVLARLPESFRNRDRVAMVAVPFEWERLLSGGLNGLELRTMLASMLPGPGAEDIIAAEIPETRPRTEAAATAHRRILKTKVDECVGALNKAREQHKNAVATPPAAGPTEEQVKAATDAVAAVAAAVEATASAREALAVWNAATKARADWTAKQTSVGGPPSVVIPADAEVDAARKLLLDLRKEQEELSRSRDADVSHLYGLENELARLSSQAPPEVPCRGGDVRVDLDPASDSGSFEDVDCSTCPLLQKYGKPFDPTPLNDEIAALQQPIRAARLRIDQINNEISQASQQIAIHGAAARAHALYNQELAALGPQPPDPGPKPAVPEIPDVSAHRRVLASAEADVKIRADYDARVAKLKVAEAKSLAEHQRAEAALARAEADLAVIRGAPSRALAAKMAALGDGPLRFHVGAAFTATINNRPLVAVTSRGERLIADADFRRRLRDACGMRDVPIFVDNRQDAAGDRVGDLPEIPNSFVFITTATAEVPS